MSKIWLILKREYLVRVRKKSFIIMTFLAPLLMAAILIVPSFIASKSNVLRAIAVQEENFEVATQLSDKEFLRFSMIPDLEAEKIKQNFNQSGYDALLHIDNNMYTLYSNQQISLSVKNEIENQLTKIKQYKKLKDAGVSLDLINQKTIEINTKLIEKDGKIKNSQTETSMGVGFMCGILVYMFIFMYGTMVMRGVIEEKTNRIVEVIISSVKPFQLMMGKILGIALVGLTQFALWIFLTTFIAGISSYLLIDVNSLTNELQASENQQLLNQINSLFGEVNILQIFIAFIIYFLGGYLMYSSLFAAIGSAVDAEADTQQFILPITIPLILSFLLIQPVMDNPDGPLAFWMSIIPFTSPVIMMVRLPFGVTNLDLIISITVLICSFILSTWFAGKIYRTGILMYGKKPSYKEIWKWISYKS